MKSEKLVFFGSDSFSLPALKAMHEAGYQIAAVITKPDRPAGRGQTMKSSEAKVLAESLGIKVLQPEKLINFSSNLKELGAASAIAVSYGAIIPKEIINLFPDGIINIHPSLLPKYRGPSPIEATILNGDTETGVTLMKIDEGMDSGPIFTQAKISLKDSESKSKLYELLSKLGAQLLSDNLAGILEGQLKGTPQDPAQSTATKMITKADGMIDWSKPALQIEREVRAYAGWPGSHTTLFERDVVIIQVHKQDERSNRAPGEAFVTEKKELAVTCNPGTLIIDKLKPAGKNEMTGTAFIAGYGKELGR